MNRPPMNLSSMFAGMGGPDPNLLLAAIPEHFYDGLNPDFAARLRALDQAAPPGIFEDIGAISGYRSNDHQARLYANALERYGSEAEARRWVAPPGSSRHNYGLAMDLTYGSPAARVWVHANAGDFGLHFPMSWENWHIEPVGADGGRVPLGDTPPLSFAGSVTPQAGAPDPGLAAMFGLDMGALGPGPVGLPVPPMGGRNVAQRRNEREEQDRAENARRLALIDMMRI